MVDSALVNLMGHCATSDSFMEHLKFLDFPLESVEEGTNEEGGEDWNAKLQSALGPIPVDFLSRCLNENIVSESPDLMLDGSETMTDEGGSELLPPHLGEDASNMNKSVAVQPLSPISVLDDGDSCKLPTIIPKRARTKRSRPLEKNVWADLVVERGDVKKGRKIPEKKTTTLGAYAPSRKCSHCQVTHTPQWREGPMGPKTLCNACGVRYRSGRLFPEYRPMASPDFKPSLHSNSHKKVLEMRNKGNMKLDTSAEANVAPIPPRRRVKKDPIYERENSPPPEFIPMSDYLLDCVLGCEVFNY